ncbi:MAG: rod shape-determining protein MreD [Gammaproteobacteria bacterium]|nr:rod shape-determining protein MreD [Gammaproteobacteria bacterium]
MLRLSMVIGILYVLSIIPLGVPLVFFRPLWLLLFVIYLQCTAPKQMSVLFIMLLGLVLDALGAGALGQQAFALLLTAWVVSKRAQRFRLLLIPQQLFGVAIFSCLYQLILLLIQLVLGYPISIGGIFLPVVMTVLCWPWMQYFCDRIFFSPVRQANRNNIINHNK